MKGPTRSTRRQAGFQLIELMIFLTVLGIGMAVAVPSFTRINSRQRIEGAAQQMAARLQVARQMAVSRRVEYRLVIEADNLVYRFERQEDDSSWVREPDKDYQVAGTGGMLVAIGTGPASTIHFEPRGTVAAEDAPARVQFVTPCGSDTATVVLVRTGRTTVQFNRVQS